MAQSGRVRLPRVVHESAAEQYLIKVAAITLSYHIFKYENKKIADILEKPKTAVRILVGSKEIHCFDFRTAQKILLGETQF